MRKLTLYDKEELYDVISALNASIRDLRSEIIELQGIQLDYRNVLSNIAYHLEEMLR